MTHIKSYLVLSTQHLTPDVSDLLGEKGPDCDDRPAFGDWRDKVRCCEYAYGHWIRVIGRDEDGWEERIADMPECLRDCMEHASAYGCTYIQFDRDEDAIPDLREYDWGS